MSLEGRTIVITGAGGLIGRETALAVAREGARTLLVDIDRRTLAESRDLVAAVSPDVEIAEVDCSRSADVRAYVGQALDRFGTIDGFFNNAGIEGRLAPVADYDEDEWNRVIGVNLTGVFLGLRHVLPVMLRQKRGSIVNTGSLASERGLPMTPAYNAAKHAVLGLTRSAASETGRHGVRVNAVLPGMIETRMLRSIVGTIFDGDEAKGLETSASGAPMRRNGQPQEIAEVVAFLLSDKASFVHGAGWAVDGGFLAVGGNGG